MSLVLVTGATGTVGSRVVGGLRARGVPVRAFVRDPARAATVLGDAVELAAGDLGDPAAIRRALDGVDRVFLASPNHPRQREFETNVIDAAAAAGTPWIVKLSTIGAEVGSPLAFWDCHGRIEAHLAEAGVPATLLRPHFYMSNLLGSADAIRATGKLFAPAGGARIPMVDPGDVAAAATAVLAGGGHEGRVYHLTGPEAITFDTVAEQLSAASGRPVDFVHVPDPAARASLLQSGMPPWMADNLLILFGILRAGRWSVSDDVRALTGQAPRGFADFARAHAAAFGG
ncbi:MAG TPA: SDR family oxidoreductase [Longimicrobiales bacterium]|nr:SDR family oxidoreductase [Longimicrobiales bacterium]